MPKRRTLREIYKSMHYDPARDQVVKLLAESGLSVKGISFRTGVSESTLRNWAKGKTKRPQKITMDFALRVTGHEFKIVPRVHR